MVGVARQTSSTQETGDEAVVAKGERGWGIARGRKALRLPDEG